MAQPSAKKARTLFSGTVAGLTTGEVRFASPVSAQKALQLDGTLFQGHAISVALDARSKDQTKVIVGGLPAQLAYSELQRHFATCGEVKFADVKSNVPITATVRFETAQIAQEALGLSGTDLDGHEVTLQVHAGSKDGTKLQISNLPPGLEWQELKDFLAKHGFKPMYCDISSSAKGTVSAEVRYEDAAAAQLAVETLQGSILGGAEVSISLDTTSKDGTKVLVGGIPRGLEWQDLKDHFAQCGMVAFVRTDDGSKGKGKGCMGVARPMMGGFPPAFPAAFPAGCGGYGCAAGGTNMQQSMMMHSMMMNLWMQQSMGGGCGKGATAPSAGMPRAAMGGGIRGELRYDNPAHALMAYQTLNSTMLKGAMIRVGLDQTSPDGTKLWVTGLAPGTNWQELKDHFARIGTVAFANIK